MVVIEVYGDTAYCWKLGWDENRPKPFGINTLKIWDKSLVE